MRDDFETVWEFHTYNFIVTYDVAPEDCDPRDCFEFDEDVEAIRNGSVEWFQVRVAVHLRDANGARGEILGADYLGACAYKSFDAFRTSHFSAPYESRNTQHAKSQNVVFCDYFTGMVHEAISAARERMAALKSIPLRAA